MQMNLGCKIVRDDIFRVSQYLNALESLRGRHLLIAGGTGFFGRWMLALCDGLNEQGWGLRVTVISRNPGAFLAEQPYYQDCSWLAWLGADICALPAVDSRFDYLIFAATDSSLAGQADRLKLFDQMYQGARQIFEFAVRHGVSRVLLAGSGAQYGRSQGDNPFSEADSCACNSNDAAQVYGEGKRVQEMLGALYAERYGIEVVHTRGFAFVGPGLPMNGHFAIGNFIRDALYAERIVLNSSGLALRSYLYGADLAGWLLTLLARGAAGGVYNVGSDQAISIADLARRVCSVLSPGKLVDIPNDSGEGIRSRYVPDIRLAKDLGLGVWTPLDLALKQTASWYLSAS